MRLQTLNTSVRRTHAHAEGGPTAGLNENAVARARMIAGELDKPKTGMVSYETDELPIKERHLPYQKLGVEALRDRCAR